VANSTSNHIVQQVFIRSGKPTKAEANLDNAPANLDIAPANLDIAPANLDIAPANLDIAPANLDIAPANLDIAPANLDIAPANLDIAPANIAKRKPSPLEGCLKGGVANSTNNHIVQQVFVGSRKPTKAEANLDITPANLDIAMKYQN
jgi:hypothetical protein